jgi:nitrite reductase/ring-hydroxylating ferredoxin subunit
MSERKKINRRDFLKLTGLTGGAFILASCSGNKADGELTFMDRLKGDPLTELPQIEDAWMLEGDQLTLDLAKLPELDTLGGAVRIEGDVLANPVLVILGEDDNYYAFQNACTHAGRMIDPVAGTMTLECCSVSSSTFDYQGNVLSGPAEGALTSYALEKLGDQLIINLN